MDEMDCEIIQEQQIFIDATQNAALLVIRRMSKDKEEYDLAEKWFYKYKDQEIDRLERERANMQVPVSMI